MLIFKLLMMFFLLSASFTASFRGKSCGRIGIVIYRSVAEPGRTISYCKQIFSPRRTFVPRQFQLFHSTKTNEKSADDECDIVAVKAKDVVIPLDKVDFNYARSSGPGGQNVNKLNTKAEIRFHVMSADWIPFEARQRLLAYQSNRISKEGELIVSSQDHRTQTKNKEACISKLQEMVAEALITPKEREMWVGLSEKTKEKRKSDKRKRAEVKANRRKNANDWF